MDFGIPHSLLFIYIPGYPKHFCDPSLTDIYQVLPVSVFWLDVCAVSIQSKNTNNIMIAALKWT